MYSTPPSGPCGRGKETRIKALEIAKLVSTAIAAKNGEETLILDVRRHSGVTDYTVITSGSSAPHIRAIAGEIELTLKQKGSPVYRRSGELESGWLVLDYVDVIVHIFTPERRQYYAIEELWEKAPRLK